MPVVDHGVADLAPIAVAAPILGAALLMLLGRRVPRLALDVAALVVAAAEVALVADVFATSTSGRVVTWVAGWTPHKGYSVGIVLVNDPVGAGAALCAASLVFLALLYSAGYIDSVHGHFHCLMLLFLAGMVGMAMTGDLFDMFCFFELMGAAAYGLTGMKVEEESSLQGALNFGIVNSLGAYISLVGIGILFAHTGSLSLPILGRDLAHQRPDALIVAAFVLVLTGFLVRAAMVPFHFWLADAHAVAPAPVCALFSGVMAPLGAYAAFRIYWTVFAPVVPVGDVRRAFLVLGATTAVVGAIMTLGQRHVKRLLAYSTVAQLGLLLLALACLTSQGTAGALLDAAGHAGVKGALFLIAGVLLDLYGTMDEAELFGRAARHRVLGWLFVAGGLALAALPPFGTGLGEAVSAEAAVSLGYTWVPAVFVAVSAATGGAVLRVGARAFFGLGRRPVEEDGAPSSDEEPDVHLRRVPVSMTVPVVALLLAALATGVLPGARSAAERAGAYFVDHAGYVSQALTGAQAHMAVHARANWAALGVGLDVLSALLAVGIAAAACYGPRLPALLALQRRPMRILRAVHSGRVGDYVAWLMVGVAVLAGLVGLPLR